jgi:RNA polymerase-binding transcription factor DksA
MDIDDLEYCKNLIIKKRMEILATDNFSNWFADKNSGNSDECGDYRGISLGINGRNECNPNENDIHSKTKILQYLLLLDNALILIKNGNYGTCINCNEKIALHILQEAPVTQYCSECE